MFVQVHSMTFAQRRNRLTTHFSEHIPVVKWRMTALWPGNKCSGRCRWWRPTVCVLLYPLWSILIGPKRLSLARQSH